MAACLGVLTLGTPKGILVAILLSMISLAIQAAHPRVYLIGRKGGADVSRRRAPRR